MTEGERIGIEIRQKRKQCGYTQEKVANDLFISQSYLRQIEHGLANPSVNMVQKITSYLNMALGESLNDGEA
ncbi:helix-turn-helix domain-containing protein [Feifania hominis]|uniref:Helix-turn-helix transcriptional regulator n=1 Tax=Feifania hominis TaxID=2763660 RepID=A0A926DCJ6_9FIRM|nr:helix-turn-helix transcriptional regulator [Feifania hominis]MBC8535372.1 helix-turn-helix transcriptional regulator [Feifania hominis]